jgi:hypothetical protein
MTQKESHSGTQRSSPSNLVPPEFAAFGTNGLEGLVHAQSGLFEKIQKANQVWLERMQMEATVATEFATKLMAARSVPETAAVWQEWAARRMEMAAEDGKRLLETGQQFMETGARLLSKGSLLNGRRGST